MNKIRSGIGYDIHRLKGGNGLLVGGVKISGSLMAEAHSDGDVLIHSLIDAFLGAMGQPDIGELFPDSDPQWAGADSRVLLRGAAAGVAGAGWRVANVDATVICQAPRLAPFLPEMAKRLAATMGLGSERVSVKAKSPEHLGLLGREEGIASMAVVSVETA